MRRWPHDSKRADRLTNWASRIAHGHRWFAQRHQSDRVPQRYSTGADAAATQEVAGYPPADALTAHFLEIGR
jgi:hypothetical protein